MLIYLVRNRVNGKVYVGKTHGKTPKPRWAVHISHAKSGVSKKNYFHNALRKYGVESFDLFEVCRAESPEHLIEREKCYIRRLGSFDPSIGYNCTMGGEGSIATDATRKRMSDARRGKKLKPETIEKIRSGKIGEKNHFFGKTHTQENRDIMGASFRGKKQSTEHVRKRTAHRKGIRQISPMQGNTHSEETKQKFSAIRKAAWSDPTYRALQISIIRANAKQRGEAIRLKWQDPEYRLKRHEARKSKT